jgi:hypothetical protein
MPAVSTPNADFINRLYGAKKVEPGSISPLVVCSTAERKRLVQGHIQQSIKTRDINVHIAQPENTFTTDRKKTLESLPAMCQSKQFDLFALIGVIVNNSSGAFINFFSDFKQHIQHLCPMEKIAAGSLESPLKRTPLPDLIEAGVGSAAHLWEAIIKAVIIKQGNKLNLEQFKKILDNSGKLLLELTQVPLLALIDLETYLLNRPDEHYAINSTPVSQAKERCGRDIEHRAISYDPKSGEINLDQQFLEHDAKFQALVAQTRSNFVNEDMLVHGCAGLQSIPYFFEQTKNLFDKYLFPHFDEIMRFTKF